MARRIKKSLESEESSIQVEDSDMHNYESNDDFESLESEQDEKWD